jgi:predicted nucleic acid-binding protein
LNVYFETSALIKLFLDEPGADDARDLWDAADLVTIALIAYPEARAALAAAERARRISAAELGGVKQRLDRRWIQAQVIDFDQPIALTAGDISERFALRGYNAVHLATAMSLQDDSLLIATWDRELASACLEAGLRISPPL